MTPPYPLCSALAALDLLNVIWAIEACVPLPDAASLLARVEAASPYTAEQAARIMRRRKLWRRVWTPRTLPKETPIR